MCAEQATESRVFSQRDFLNGESLRLMASLLRITNRFGRALSSPVLSQSEEEGDGEAGGVEKAVGEDAGSDAAGAAVEVSEARAEESGGGARVETGRQTILDVHQTKPDAGDDDTGDDPPFAGHYIVEHAAEEELLEEGCSDGDPQEDEDERHPCLTGGKVGVSEFIGFDSRGLEESSHRYLNDHEEDGEGEGKQDVGLPGHGPVDEAFPSSRCLSTGGPHADGQARPREDHREDEEHWVFGEGFGEEGGGGFWVGERVGVGSGEHDAQPDDEGDDRQEE